MAVSLPQLQTRQRVGQELHALRIIQVAVIDDDGTVAVEDDGTRCGTAHA
jgi:hypothetical protein